MLFRFVAFDASVCSPAQLKNLAVQTQSVGIAIALNVADAKSFQACLDAGVNAAPFGHQRDPFADQLMRFQCRDFLAGNG